MSLSCHRSSSTGRRAAIVYCPMARKYWLQKGDAVQNPYYGKQMSDCGRIVSDIPTFNQ